MSIDCLEIILMRMDTKSGSQTRSTYLKGTGLKLIPITSWSGIPRSIENIKDSFGGESQDQIGGSGDRVFKGLHIY